MDEAPLERFRLENDRLRREVEELKAKLKIKENETKPPSDTIYVTNVVPNQNSLEYKPMASGGL